MKYKALVTAEVLRDRLETLSDRIDFTYAGYTLDHEVMPEEELRRRVADIDILVCEYDTIDSRVFDAAKNLKLLICCRGGVKSVVDLDAAMEHGVIVCNNVGRNAHAVADMTIGFMLDMTRNITRTDRLIHDRVITMDFSTKPKEYRDTVWGLDNDSPFIRFRGDSLNHMTLGLVGFGHAGRAVARRAAAFDMNILIYDPYVDAETLPEGVTAVKFDRLLAESDVISLHCVATPQTKGMFGKAQFDAMKNGAYFINTSRGELVDEAALIDALNDGKLKGAAIDVTAVEPIADDCPLLDAKNLLITPHIAGSSLDVQAEGTRMVVESLTDFLADRKPANCVIYR